MRTEYKSLPPKEYIWKCQPSMFVKMSMCDNANMLQIFNLIHRNKLQWNCNQNIMVVIQQNMFENVTYKIEPFPIGLNMYSLSPLEMLEDILKLGQQLSTVPDGTKPSPDLTLIYHQWDHALFTWLIFYNDWKQRLKLHIHDHRHVQGGNVLNRSTIKFLI